MMLYRVELSDANAHAWTEIYLEDYGWIPYEMTPPMVEENNSSNGLGILGIFAGLFNPTERLVDDTDESSLRDSVNDLLYNSSQTDGINGNSSDSFIGKVSQFIRSVGYLFLPFIWMIIAIIVILSLFVVVRILINKIKINNLIKTY